MHKSILGMKVDVTSLPGAVSQVNKWCSQREGRYICVSNVHMCMEAFDDKHFQLIVNNSDLVVPDGRPLIWAQSLLGAKEVSQVRGMDLMLSLCENSIASNINIGFYGGTTETLKELERILKNRFSNINIVCSISPPFRPLSEKENTAYIKQITDSCVNVLFVGIGCPKQERWMAENVAKLHCVMIGVGAAFDFIAGNKKHAPLWMQKIGLEWFFRFINEPKRLWKRYFMHNPRFVVYFIFQLLTNK